MGDEVINLHGQPLQIKVSRGPGGRYDYEVSLFGLDPVQTIEMVKSVVEKLNLEYPYVPQEKGKA